MIRQYIDAAMRRAKYEILAEDSTYYGEISGLEGVYANAETLEACRDELEEVLEEWVLFRASRNLAVPVIDGRELQVRKVS
jgi:predicted RNase H-like HicB family nuclease